MLAAWAMAPEPGRRERKKEETRARIIALSVELFEAHGFDAITMEQIAEAADLAKATLYSYFPSKEHIVAAYMRSEISRCLGGVQQMLERLPDTRARLRALFRGSTEWNLNHPQMMPIYVRHRMANGLDGAGQRSGFNEHVLAIVARGQDEGDLRRDLPAGTLTRHLQLLYMGEILAWMANQENYDLQAGLEVVVDLFLDGAGA